MASHAVTPIAGASTAPHDTTNQSNVIQVLERMVYVPPPGERLATWMLDNLHIDKLTGERTKGRLFLFELHV